MKYVHRVPFTLLINRYKSKKRPGPIEQTHATVHVLKLNIVEGWGELKRIKNRHGFLRHDHNRKVTYVEQQQGLHDNERYDNESILFIAIWTSF